MKIKSIPACGTKGSEAGMLFYFDLEINGEGGNYETFITLNSY